MGSDVTEVITMAIQWIMYPILNWSFTFAGVTMTFSDFILGCLLFGICVYVLKDVMAGAHGLKVLNLLKGKIDDL